jgi:DNA-binding transcriptional ArsR family regulator
MARSKRLARPRDVRRLATLFRTAADPIRLSVLLQLGDRERSVGALGRAIACNLTTLSHHLAQLRLAGLVEGRSVGRWRVYRLTDDGRDLLRFAEALAGGR